MRVPSLQQVNVQRHAARVDHALEEVLDQLSVVRTHPLRRHGYIEGQMRASLHEGSLCVCVYVCVCVCVCVCMYVL